MVMRDGLSPTQVMAREERNSQPQEVMDKAEADPHNIIENRDSRLREHLKKVLRDQLERGVPISYGDDEGRVLRRYPDRKIFVAKMNMETFESTETFLRMATPEDDVDIYD